MFVSPRTNQSELVNDGLEMKLLCGEQWKTFSQINSRLRAEDRESASAGAIVALLPVIENKMEKFVILTHLTNVTFVQREATEKPAEVALFFRQMRVGPPARLCVRSKPEGEVSNDAPESKAD